MGHAKLEYTPIQVDEAGRALVNPYVSDAELDDALRIIANWRACHSHPLMTFRIGLERRSQKIYPKSLVAQRLKRLSSVKSKLRRIDTLTLSVMQDIAGCRAVLGNASQVKRLVKLYKASDIKHKLERINDYIAEPKYSGYRGVHLIYSYFSDRNETYNGLKVELQLRSPLQHAWATAVETVDRFTLQALKSGAGNKKWRRFFAYMSAYIAFREKCNPVPNVSNDRKEIKEAIRRYAEKLGVEDKLEGFRQALRITEQPKMDFGQGYFLMQLDAEKRYTRMWGYKMNQLAEANDHYLKLELEGGRGRDQVLVSSDSIAQLKRAYPNYFADTDIFLRQLRHALD